MIEELLGFRAPSEDEEEKRVVVKRLVLDVVKPHNPSIVDIAEGLSELKNVTKVDIEVKDYDSNIERLKLVIEGEGLDYDEIVKVIRYYGGNVASLDGVTVHSYKREEKG